MFPDSRENPTEHRTTILPRLQNPAKISGFFPSQVRLFLLGLSLMSRRNNGDREYQF